MYPFIISYNFELGSSLSALSKSPADKWTQLNYFYIYKQMVPFPVAGALKEVSN